MSFSDAKLVGLVVGAVLLVFLVPLERVLRLDRLRIVVPLLFLYVWAVLVAGVREDSFFQGSGKTTDIFFLVELLCAVLLLGAASPRDLQKALALSAIPVAVLALGQYAGLLRGMFPQFPEYDQRMYSVFGNQDLLGGYLAIGLALGFALWLEGAISIVAAVILLISALPVLLLSGSRSAWFAAGLGAALAAWQGRGQRQKIAGAGAAALVLAAIVFAAAPGATWHRLAGSFAASDTGYRIRLWVWDGAVYLIQQHPIAGMGLGNFAYYSPRALGEVLHERGPGVHMFNHIHVQHAESDLLEIAAEAGLMGIALLGTFLLLIPRRRSPAWAGLVAAFAFSLVNTTLHSPVHVLAVLLLAGSLVQAEEPASFRRPIKRIERWVLAVALSLFVSLMTVSSLFPSWMHARAEVLYNAGKLDEAEAAYFRATYTAGGFPAAVDLATLYANRRRVQLAISTAEYAAEGVDTGDLWYLRAYLSERNRPMKVAAQLYRECLLRWPDHRPAYEGLVCNTGPAEREAILAEAKRWLSPADYEAVKALPSAPR